MPVPREMMMMLLLLLLLLLKATMNCTGAVKRTRAPGFLSFSSSGERREREREQGMGEIASTHVFRFYAGRRIPRLMILLSSSAASLAVDAALCACTITLVRKKLSVGPPLPSLRAF